MDGLFARHSAVIVTIDGVVGAGKSSAAKLLAEKLDLPMVNSGLIYRSVGWLCLQSGVDLADKEACAAVMDSMNLDFTGHEQITVNGQPLTAELRTPAVDEATHKVAAIPAVRAGVHVIQRQLASKHGAVVEGRGIGRDVFPSAEIKFWLEADAKVREARIASQRGEEVAKQMMARDHADATREHEPNTPADEAIHVDSSSRNLEEVVAYMLSKIQERVI